MNEINAARRLRVAALEKAEAEKLSVVKAAEAEAEAKFLQGQGIARQRAAIISGLKESVTDFHGCIDTITAKDALELMLLTQCKAGAEQRGKSESEAGSGWGQGRQPGREQPQARQREGGGNGGRAQRWWWDLPEISNPPPRGARGEGGALHCHQHSHPAPRMLRVRARCWRW